jgi:hypothetical protein
MNCRCDWPHERSFIDGEFKRIRGRTYGFQKKRRNVHSFKSAKGSRMKNPQTCSEKASEFLVNKLSVKDARRLLLHEGGEITWLSAATQIGIAVLTALLSARAIWNGDATSTHLVLPLVAQYFSVLTMIPLLQLFYRLKGLNKDVRQCLINLTVILTVGLLLITFRASQASSAWLVQFQSDTNWVYDWIIQHEMHWPMISAAIGMGIAMPARFRIFRDHGPPFVSVSFGCAGRVVIFMLSFFLLPLIAQKGAYVVWWIWSILIAGDILALWLLLDVQWRLRKHDAKAQPNLANK